MRKVIRLFLMLSIIFAPFTIWLALTDYIRINLLFLGIAAFLSLKDKGPHFYYQKNTYTARFCLYILLSFIFISFFINSQIRPQPKLVSNFVGTVSIIIFFYFVYSFLVDKYLSLELIIKSYSYSGVVLMAIVIADSILVNFLDIRISSLFELNKEIGYPYFDRGLWTSTAAPTGEPAHAITFLNILFPFVLYYYKGWIRIIYVMCYIFCLFSSFSVTAYVTIIVVPIALLVTNISSSIKRKIILVYLLLSFIFVFYAIHNNQLQDVINATQFVDKVSMSGNTPSDSQRLDGMTMGLEHGMQSPIYGMGPGYGKVAGERGYLSLFLSILGCYGFIAFFSFVFFWMSFYFKCLKIVSEIKIYLIVSFYVVTIACCINDNIHILMIWILFPFINKVYNEQRSIVV